MTIIVGGFLGPLLITGGLGGSVVAGQTFRQTLAAKLNSIAPLTAIVGGAIYTDALPQTHVLSRNGPALVFEVVTYPRGMVLMGSDGTGSPRVEFSAYAQGTDDAKAQVDAIALALFEALMVVPPANPWGDGTIAIRSVTHQDESDQSEAPKAGGDQRLYCIVSEYLITHWL